MVSKVSSNCSLKDSSIPHAEAQSQIISSVTPLSFSIMAEDRGSADSPLLRRHSLTDSLTPRARAIPAGVPVQTKGTLSSPAGETIAMASEVVPVSV